MKKNKGTKLLYAVGVCGLALGAIAPAIPVTSNLVNTQQVAKADTGTNSLTIHKYEKNSGTEADGTQANDGTEKTVTNKPLKGISFNVTPVTLKSGYTWAQAVDPTTHVINEDAITRGTKQTVTTAADGSAKLSDLPDGVYLVEELANPTVETAADPFLVQLPLKSSSADGTITNNSDVHVYPKNVSKLSSAAVTKTFMDGTLDTSDVDVNDKEVTWLIQSEVPADAYQAATADTPEFTAKEFSIIDPLDEQLTYKSISGFYGAETDTNLSPLVVGADYVINVDSNNVAIISLTEAGIKKTAGKKVAFQVVTTINDFGTVKDGLYEPIANKVSTHYDPNGANTLNPTDPTDPTTDPDDEISLVPQVELGRIDIKKTKDDADKSALAGAKFKLVEKTSADSTYADDKAANGFVKGTFADGKMTTSDSDLELTSGEDGTLFANGLENGKEYWVVETEAPKGYEIIEPFAVKAAYDTTNDATVADPTDFVSEYLPITGGQLRLILMVAGSSLVIISGAALYLRKKKENESLAK